MTPMPEIPEAAVEAAKAAYYATYGGNLPLGVGSAGMRAALEAAREHGGGWLAIESAPKDGTHILAIGPEPTFDGPAITQRETYFVSSEGTPSHGNVDGWFRWSEPMNNWAASWKPTHWRALDLPPAPQDGGGR